MPPLDFLNILSKTKGKFTISQSNKKSSLETNLGGFYYVKQGILINLVFKKVIFLLKIKIQTLWLT